MHADLKWLAENVSEWGGTYSFKHIFLKDGMADYSSEPCGLPKTFTRAQWQAARNELEDPFSSPEEDEAWREAEKKINPVWQSPHDAGGVCVFHGCRYSAHEQCYMCVLAGEAAKEEAKQARYQDTAGEDWIDEAARTFTPEEFRGAMRFSIGKYNRRMGKKDDLASEIEKMRDYCTRWLEVEVGR